MQHLSEKWLRLINFYFIAGSAVMFGMYVFFAIQQQTLMVSGKEAFGVSITSGAFALGCLLYNLILLRAIKGSNVWLAYAMSLVLFALANNTAVELSLNTAGSFVYLVNNYIVIFAAVAFGPTVALFGVIILCIIYAMTVAGTTTPTSLGIIGDGISVLVRVVVIVLLLYKFRNKYVTESKQTETNYIERYFVDNEVVKLLTDSISDGVIIIDHTGVVQSINPGAAQLLHQNQKDVLDLNYRSVLHFKTMQNTALAEADEPVNLALTEKRSINQELILAEKDNQQKFVDVTISAIANPNTGQLYGGIIILRDVSKKKQEERERSEFISTASHEMRTPVAAIEGYLGLALNDRVSKIDAKAREYLTKAHASTQHLGRLFQDLLISAKAEDGRLASHPSVVEIGALLDQLVEEYKIIAGKKNLQLEYVISSGKAADKKHTLRVLKPLYYANVDPDRLREVITNLFDNAIKYTKQGTITIGLTGDEEVVQLFVKDMGIGISADDLPHLFQKFYRVDSSDTRTTGGTGLGLFICRKILDLYNGRIWAESEIGKGSTFYVNLPRISSMQATTSQEQAKVLPAQPIPAAQATAPATTATPTETTVTATTTSPPT